MSHDLLLDSVLCRDPGRSDLSVRCSRDEAGAAMSESLALLCCVAGVTAFIASIVGYVAGYRAAVLFKGSLPASVGEGADLPGGEAADVSPCSAPLREGAETEVRR